MLGVQAASRRAWPGRFRMKRILRDYSLSIVLAVLFLVAWVLQTVMGWYDF